MVADYVSPLDQRLLITSGSYVPEAKLPPRVIDSMTSVDVDLKSHLGEDFARNGPEFICLGTCEEGQIGVIDLRFRRFSLEDTHKFAFVETIGDANRQWLVREPSKPPWLPTSASKGFVGRFMGSLVDGFGQVEADGLAWGQLVGGQIGEGVPDTVGAGEWAVRR